MPLKFPVGAEVEGPVTRMMKFGAFVELAEGVEGLVHVSEITAERHVKSSAGFAACGAGGEGAGVGRRYGEAAVEAEYEAACADWVG